MRKHLSRPATFPPGWSTSCSRRSIRCTAVFGDAPRHLHAPALHFGLRRIAAGHTALLEAVKRTLDAAGSGGLFDAVEGGVFRYCAGRDWTAPSVEKLLAVNAEALELLLDGWSVLGDAGCRDRAVGVIRYAAETLADREAGGFYASQYADERYFAAAAEERARLGVPPVDRSVYAEGTARMAAAFLQAAARFEDSSLAEFAAAALERVVGETYERGNGIAHAADGGEAVRGLLADQVWTSAALLELYAAAERGGSSRHGTGADAVRAPPPVRPRQRPLRRPHRRGGRRRPAARPAVPLRRQLHGGAGACAPGKADRPRRFPAPGGRRSGGPRTGGAGRAARAPHRGFSPTSTSRIERRAA